MGYRMSSRGAVWAAACMAVVYLATPRVRAAEPIEEVVITSTKRPQSMQDASVSVSAIDTEALIDAQIDTLEDIQQVLPGIKVGNDFSFAKIFVRGIGLNSAFPGLDPSVALHVDGAVVAQAAGQFTSLFDVERVELLRGPQGTLYGRNATGGSINLITKKPTVEPEGYARVTVGGRDLNLLTDAALGGPLLGESVLGRVAVHLQDRDGYGTHTGTGKDIDDAKVRAGRTHLLFALQDDVELLLSAEYYDENDHSKAFKFLEPSFPDTEIPGLRALGLPNVQARSRNLGGDFRPTNDRETWSVTSNLSFELTPAITLRSITNHRQLDDLLIQDFDTSDTVVGSFPPAPTSTTQLQGVTERQSSQELQLVYGGESLTGLVGLYWITEKVNSDIRIGRDPENLPDRSRVNILADLDVDAHAAFANFSYAITDHVSVKFGGRFSAERRQVTNRFGVASPTDAEAIYDARKKDVDRFSHLSPELGLEYRPLDNLLAYATYSEGFKSGTANLGERSPSVVDPEKIESFELGLKSDFFDGRLIANLALFDFEVEDGQFDRTFPIAAPPFFAVTLENAATTEGRGAELEARWLAAEGLSLNLAGTLYDIEFDDFQSRNPLDPALFGPGGASVPPLDLSGNPTRNTPDWTLQLGATYELLLPNGGTLALGADLSATDRIYFTEFKNPRLSQSSYTLIDANLRYTTPDGRVSVSLFAKNITDEFVLAGAFAIATSRTIGGTYLPPRTYGVTISYSF
jgi:iron complex outermembrane recepter protein